MDPPPGFRQPARMQDSLMTAKLADLVVSTALLVLAGVALTLNEDAGVEVSGHRR